MLACQSSQNLLKVPSLETLPLPLIRPLVLQIDIAYRQDVESVKERSTHTSDTGVQEPGSRSFCSTSSLVSLVLSIEFWDASSATERGRTGREEKVGKK